MPDDLTRRNFLNAAGLSMVLPGAANAQADRPSPSAIPHALGGPDPEPRPGRPRVAALASTYYYLSHAYHIVGRFLDGFVLHDDRGFYRPGVDVVSLYTEQFPEGAAPASIEDLGREKAEQYKVRVSPTVEDALTLGTGELAVDAVLLIAEHGDYPLNEKLQKLYPRGEYFRQVMEVFRRSGRGVPVFIDKHLSYDRAEAAAMVAAAREVGAPLMAGSSLPVTWRLPHLEVPLGRKWEDALVASRGEIEIFGFHALETLQCMVERRDLGGNPQGVVAVTYLEGDAVWEAGDSGRWSWERLDEALSRNHTQNPGDVRQNTLDFVHPAGRPTFLQPVAFLVEYADGFTGTVLILNGHVDDTSIAARVVGDDGNPVDVSTLVYLPAPPGADFFTPLVLRIEDFFLTGRPPYPVERTQLTGGVLDAALESRIRGGSRIETPDLAGIDYRAPEDSGYIRAPVANPRPNLFT
ncbi:hypothetical protein [Tautonia plasticadhaerens]|uniref:Gfo/Idh/MocA-like oxidoreductase N-terminal domain-containing protein n=1 Tax=Tautonia plasticadhaerens TaxID=2527974 RepID=A0A518GWV5_9BACT|nr:hypothetical protein [Tautonia plasticadhaerens]QDV33076.1 hypothetical protein ElP_09180 [Tautonia plasticadhaerens]